MDNLLQYPRDALRNAQEEFNTSARCVEEEEGGGGGGREERKEREGERERVGVKERRRGEKRA